MAKIITTEKPLVVQKERKLEMDYEIQLMEKQSIEERVNWFQQKEQIPLDVIPQRLTGENPWDADVFVWVWWEITVG